MKLVSLICFAFCINANVLNSPTSSIRRYGSEKSFKEKSDERHQLLKKEPADTVEDINDESDGGTDLYQEDILLTKEQAEILQHTNISGKGERTKRQVYVDEENPDNTWHDGKVYYSFYPNATTTIIRQFKKATKEWEKGTCLKFINDDTATDRIGVFFGARCAAQLGRTGGVQRLSLMHGCYGVGGAAHEIGHALGLLHTQTRHDRDTFITVHEENIRDGWAGQFKKESTSTNNNYGLTYDYGSLMHYGSKLSSKNRKPTMVPKDDKYTETLGSYMISFYDKLMINKHYKCNERCNEKIRHVVLMVDSLIRRRATNVYAQADTVESSAKAESPSGCGEILEATAEFKTLTDTLGEDELYFPEDDFTKCNYWIKAPKGSKIEVVFDSFPKVFATDGCIYGGVEIKTGKDRRLTGYRFCSPESSGKSLISERNIVPIITFTRHGKVTTVLHYRISQ